MVLVTSSNCREADKACGGSRRTREFSSIRVKDTAIRSIVNTTPDGKDIMMDGCQVHLDFRSLEDGRWSVTATIRCGVEGNTTEDSFQTGACDSREGAEQEALRAAIGHLGRNIDRNTSRVKNWS